MDAQTNMNAKKAVELGFADAILYDSQTQPTEDDEPPFMWNRRSEIAAVVNAMRKKLPPKQAEVVALGKEVELLERQAVIDAKMAKPTSSPITNQPAKDDGEEVHRFEKFRRGV